MGLEAGIREAAMATDEITPIIRKLGTALYTHKKKQEQAEDAGKAVDYLVEQGVLKID